MLFPNETTIFLSSLSYSFDSKRFWNALYRCLFSICWTRSYLGQRQKAALARFTVTTCCRLWEVAWLGLQQFLMAAEKMLSLLRATVQLLQRFFGVSNSPPFPEGNE